MDLNEYLVGGLLIAVVLLVVPLRSLLKARTKLKGYRARFGPAIDLEEEVTKLQSQLESIAVQHGKAASEFQELRTKLGLATEAADLAEYGYRRPKDLYEDSVECNTRLIAVRQKQKEMLKDKKAAVCDTEWSVEGSKAKGRKMTTRYLRLQLRAFNGECDALISKATYRNLDSSASRIDRSFDAINKFGETQQCRIQEEFRGLKQVELYVAHRYAELKQEEKEEQRRIREEMREEQRAAKELEQAQKEAEAEEQLRSQALETARKELEAAQGEEKARFTAQIAELEAVLAEAHAQSERARSRAQDTKTGHVYVISNVGSFGDGVFKIGMTRRLEPQDRVKELGDASVPFPFDVHAMIFSENAPNLEGQLHRKFDERRLNLINRRKEFFRVGVEELAGAVTELGGDIVFTMRAEAAEFFRTQKIREESVSPQDEIEDLTVI